MSHILIRIEEINMPLTKKEKDYIEFRKKMQPRQADFRDMLGITSHDTDNTTRGYPYGSEHSDPKEAEKRINDSMKWL